MQQWSGEGTHWSALEPKLGHSLVGSMSINTSFVGKSRVVSCVGIFASFDGSIRCNSSITQVLLGQFLRDLQVTNVERGRVVVIGQVTTRYLHTSRTLLFTTSNLVLVVA